MDESEFGPDFLNVTIKEEREEGDNSVEESEERDNSLEELKEEKHINDCFKKESIEINDIKEEHQDSFEERSQNDSCKSIVQSVDPSIQTYFTVESEEFNEIFKDEGTVVYDNIKTEFEGGIFNDSQNMLQIPLEHHDYIIRTSEDTPLTTSQEKKWDSSNKGEKNLPVPKKKKKTTHENNQNRWHLKNNFPPRLSYKCFKCKKEFRNRNDISEHLKVIHRTENYECNECGKRFLRKGHLYGHILYCHLGVAKHSKCKKRSYNKRYCDSNIGACSNTKGFQGTYICDQCDRQFVSKKCLEMHLLLTCGKKICLCVEDKISSVKIASMLKHKIQQFNCEVCHKCFDNKISFHNHLSIHKNIKHFICMQCGKYFAMEKHLVSHLKIHRGVKDYICLKCGKRFYAKTDLNRHQISHTGIKKFVCAICGQHFSQRVNLCRHLKLHNGSESYKCDVCNKYFRAKSNRDRHVLTHKDIYFHCGICNKSLKDKGWFLKHVKSHKDSK